MKIGIVLFGHLRSYRQTHESFQLLKKTLSLFGEVDVFCHTWDIEESTTAAWWKEKHTVTLPNSNVKVKDLVSFYTPTRFAIETSRQFDDSDYKVNSSIPVAGILSMLYSQQKGFQLLKEYEKENNICYNLVVKSRYDLLFEIAPDFESILSSSVSQNCLLLPSSNPYELAGSYSDVFAIGPGNQMDGYFSFSKRFKEAIQEYQARGYRYLIPELCMSVYLDTIQLKKQELTGLRIHILRKNGKIFQINTSEKFKDNNPNCFQWQVIRNNINVLPEGNDLINAHAEKLLMKYLSWVDKFAGEQVLQGYNDFYNGSWIRSSLVIRLAKKGRRNKIFTRGIMMDFFEQSLRKGKYNLIKKLYLSILLFFFSGYGIFYFRVLMSHIIKRKNVI